VDWNDCDEFETLGVWQADVSLMYSQPEREFALRANFNHYLASDPGVSVEYDPRLGWYPNSTKDECAATMCYFW
jgi:hypothetical protein